MFEPKIEFADEETVAYLGMKGPYSQIAEGFATLYAWIVQHGLSIGGVPRAAFFTSPDEVTEAEAVWELRAPVCGDVEEVAPDASGVGVRRVAEHQYASATHVGPYDAIAPLYGQLMGWIEGQGYHVVEAPEEIYHSDPEKVPPEEYITEVRMPIARG